jgi:hypothetical protein
MARGRGNHCAAGRRPVGDLPGFTGWPVHGGSQRPKAGPGVKKLPGLFPIAARFYKMASDQTMQAADLHLGTSNNPRFSMTLANERCS